MGLEIRCAGIRFGLASLVPEAFTQDNLDPRWSPNDTLDPEITPKGVLGGSVAGVYGDLLVGRADETHRPVGLYEMNAQGINYVGNSAAGSGKLTFMTSGGCYEVDVYETRNATGATDLIYTAGDSLYTSARGFLTNEPGPGWMSREIAAVFKAPSPAEPTMWVMLWI